MERVDALGRRPERHRAFEGEILAGAEDRELQAVVEEAARSLSTPIALVTLVLERIQFFKAHCGLPSDLAASRGTERDVSFCQFVVRDGKAVEVTDAERDARLPQYLVEKYGIKSYLGVPVRARDVVVGSLCVIDRKPRTFSEEDLRSLTELAEKVNARLAALSESRRPKRSSLVERASTPALSELREALVLVRAGAAAARLASVALVTFHQSLRQSLSVESTLPRGAESAMVSARATLEDLVDALDDVEAGGDDADDSLLAMESILVHGTGARLSEVIEAAQELARHRLKGVGGAPLPDLSFDPRLATPRPLAVALLAVILAGVASELALRGSSSGVRMEAKLLDGKAEISITAQELADEALQRVVSGLAEHVGDDPTVEIRAESGAVRACFTVLP